MAVSTLLLFVTVNPKDKRTQRAKELEQSKLKSHAAREGRKAAAKKARVIFAGREQAILPSTRAVTVDRLDEDQDDLDHESFLTLSSQNKLKELMQLLRSAGIRGYHNPLSKVEGTGLSLPVDSARSFQIFWELIAPPAQTVYDVFNVRNIYCGDFIRLMTTTTFFYVAAAMTHNLLDRVAFRRTTQSAETLWYRNQAIQVLRRELAGPSPEKSDALLYAILIMGLVDKHSTDAHAFSAHKTILGQLVKARGGIDKVGTFPRAALMQLESFWALECGFTVIPRAKPPQSLVYPDLPLSPPLEDLVRSLPKGFRPLAMQRKLSLNMLDILHRVGLHMNKTSKQKEEVTQPNSAYKPELATYDDFWEACPAMILPDVGPEPSLEKLLSFAIFLYCAASQSIMIIRNRKPIWIRDQLSKLLPRCMEPRRPEEEDCLFWIWNVTVASWVARTPFSAIPNQKPPQCFDLVDAQQCRFAELIGDRNTAYAISEKFAWNDLVFAPAEEFFWI